LISSCFSGKVFEKKKIAAELFDLMDCKTHRTSINKSSFLSFKQSRRGSHQSRDRAVQTINMSSFCTTNKRERLFGIFRWNRLLLRRWKTWRETAGEVIARLAPGTLFRVVFIQLRLKVFQ